MSSNNIQNPKIKNKHLDHFKSQLTYRQEKEKSTFYDKFNDKKFSGKFKLFQ